LRDLYRLRRTGDELEFMQLLRNHGIMDENPLFAQIVKLFRDSRSGKA
jgi:hypothetical protein